MTRIILCVIVLTTLMSCNNAAKQAEREKFVADSVATAMKAQEQAKEQLQQEKTAFSDYLKDLISQEKSLQEQTAEMQANLSCERQPQVSF